MGSVEDNGNTTIVEASDDIKIASATDRFKYMFLNAVERNCILEEQLERAHIKIQQLEEPLRVRKDVKR